MGEGLAYLRELNLAALGVKFALATLFGGLIGLQRGKKRRAAGFRTYIFVCLGAAATMMLGQYEQVMLSAGLLGEISGAGADASRFGAQVINGVGFLGAGTVLVTTRREVKGVTTAAGLWASACMGLAIGAGFYECALIGFALIFFAMTALDPLESRIVANARNMDLYVEFERMDDLGGILAALKGREIRVFHVDVNQENHRYGAAPLSAALAVGLPARQPHSQVLTILAKLEGVRVIDEI